MLAVLDKWLQYTAAILDRLHCSTLLVIPGYCYLHKNAYIRMYNPHYMYT